MNISNQQREAWIKGENAFINGKRLIDNPYDPDDNDLSADLWEHWRKGYIHSQEENENE